MNDSQSLTYEILEGCGKKCNWGFADQFVCNSSKKSERSNGLMVIKKEIGIWAESMDALNIALDRFTKDIGVDNDAVFLHVTLDCKSSYSWVKRELIEHVNVPCKCGCGNYFIKFGDVNLGDKE